MIPAAALTLTALLLAAGSGDMGIREAKARHEARLLDTPGVVSIGIGLGEDGEQAIIIGVSSDVAAARETLPDTLEGYRVIVRRVGTIKAQ